MDGATMPPTRLVIFGYGNPSRGDDALGPRLLDRAAELAATRGLQPALVEDFQLQVEDALELVGMDLALFLDAAASGPSPFAFRRLAPAADPTYTSHAISPEAVLHAFRQVRRADPPPAFVLAVRGEAFELGEGLSEPALANQEAAMSFLGRLLDDPRPDPWQALADAN